MRPIKIIIIGILVIFVLLIIFVFNIGKSEAEFNKYIIENNFTPFSRFYSDLPENMGGYFTDGKGALEKYNADYIDQKVVENYFEQLERENFEKTKDDKNGTYPYIEYTFTKKNTETGLLITISVHGSQTTEISGGEKTTYPTISFTYSFENK